MSKLKDVVKTVEQKTTKNIADLEQFSIQNVDVELKKGVNNDGEEFEYYAATIGEQEYRIPLTVMVQMRTLLEANEDADLVRVIKTGEGMRSKYQVVSLDGKR